MSTVDLTVNTSTIRARINNMIKTMPKDVDRAVNMTAQQGINIIQERTDRGLGFRGRFAPYTPDYAEFRKKRGRQVSPVNLNFTGRMLGSMSARRLGLGSYRIYFARAQEAAKASGNQRKRKFFGFNTKEKKQLGAFFRKVLKL